MKIDQPGKQSVNTNSVAAKKKLDTDSKANKLNSENNNLKSVEAGKVELSEKAQRMNKAEQIAKATETSQPDKVKRLQELIDSGEYKVDAQSIADRLVDSHILFPEN